MKLVGLHVGKPRTINWKGRDVETGIFKEPVAGPVKVRKHNIDGDAQADLEVHGGEFKAVYSYAAEHYAYWRTQRAHELPFGIFGENLTTEGLDETDVNIGDKFRIGTVLLEAVQPRFPCYKLGIRFQDDTIIKQFNQGFRMGIYYRIVEEGEIRRGDMMVREFRDPTDLKIYAIATAKLKHPGYEAVLRQLAATPVVMDEWREWARKRLSE